jgi:hypothetical protein
MEIKEFDVGIFWTNYVAGYSYNFYNRIGLDFANKSGMTYISYRVVPYYKEKDKIFSKGKKKIHTGSKLEIKVSGTNTQYEKLKLLIEGFHLYIRNMLHY